MVSLDKDIAEKITISRSDIISLTTGIKIMSFSVAARAVHVDTLNEYNTYPLWIDVSRADYLVFRLKAGSDGHVYLCEYYGIAWQDAYEIVLGGWNNTR